MMSSLQLQKRLVQQTTERRLSLNEICWDDVRRKNEGSELKDEEARFVGLKVVNNMPMVYFPLGYNLSGDEKW
jgi:hypothetical protein